MNNQETKKSNNNFFWIFLSCTLVFITIVLIFNTIFFTSVVIKQSSMNPTLYDGDVVLLYKTTSVGRGDVVVIKGEKDNDEWIIKRVIAVGGDEVMIYNGRVYLKTPEDADFIPLVEDYLDAYYTFYPDPTNPNNYEKHILQIPEGELFYLGDNRMSSYDSRTNFGLENSTFGTCEKDQIVGFVPKWAISLKGVFGFFYSIKQTFI